MKFSAPISLAVQLPNASVNGRFAAINGTVIRGHMELNGHIGVAVRINDHCFI